MNPIFAFNDNVVRVLGTPDKPLFVAADVCRALQIENSRDAVGRLPDDEKGVGNSDTLGGPQSMAVVTESGLYRLIFRSSKAQAEDFRKWVFGEVLPQIRKTGAYSLPWLQQAFSEAKTGKVQMALLAAIGIVAPAESAARREEIRRPALDVPKFWEDVRGLVEHGNFPKSVFRIFEGKLLFQPGPVLVALAKKFPATYGSLVRADLRAALAEQSYFIHRPQAMRQGGRVEKVWGFMVGADSPFDLLMLVERLKEV